MFPGGKEKPGWQLITGRDLGYSSDDVVTWARQGKNLLQEPGTGKDDQIIGQHPKLSLAITELIFFILHILYRQKDTRILQISRDQ
jgi:hypothetical protein